MAPLAPFFLHLLTPFWFHFSRSICEMSGSQNHGQRQPSRPEPLEQTRVVLEWLNTLFKNSFSFVFFLYWLSVPCSEIQTDFAHASFLLITPANTYQFIVDGNFSGNCDRGDTYLQPLAPPTVPALRKLFYWIMVHIPVAHLYLLWQPTSNAISIPKCHFAVEISQKVSNAKP